MESFGSAAAGGEKGIKEKGRGTDRNDELHRCCNKEMNAKKFESQNGERFIRLLSKQSSTGPFSSQIAACSLAI